MLIELNNQTVEWLEKELEIMIDEALDGTCVRSQYSIVTMRSLLTQLGYYHYRLVYMLY